MFFYFCYLGQANSHFNFFHMKITEINTYYTFFFYENSWYYGGWIFPTSCDYMVFLGFDKKKNSSLD